MNIHLTPPIHIFNFGDNISQYFGVDRRTYQSHFGLPGHNGIDIVKDGNNGFGTAIIAAHDGTVERIGYDTPHGTRGNFIYVLDERGEFSTLYLHLATFTVNVGDKVKRYDTLGTMGNTGFVRPKPTPACPKCGTHLHFGLKVHSKHTQYRGFVDPTPYLWRPNYTLPFHFHRNLGVGSSGDDVSKLQTLLKIEGYAEDYEPIGYFGRKTARDVMKLQKREQIQPFLGYVGPKTRAYLNTRYRA